MNWKSILLKKVILFAFIFTLATVVSLTFISPQAQAAPPAAKPDKAIYVLPGFMGSRLFSQQNSGTEIWVGTGLFKDIALDAKDSQPEMANNSTGIGMSAYADRSKDTVGLFGMYLPLITSIKTCLSITKLNNDYNVEFFAYNWVQDINITAQELATDIKAKGYSSVILVAHSNGGLLASAFIAQSAANKNMVEKAVFLAAPLWGSYAALEAIETGALSLAAGDSVSEFINRGYDLFLKPITKKWIKTWAKNSPNTHQLLASNEYISRNPIFLRTGSQTQSISNVAEYYALLNKSPNTNPLLVDGNARSLRYLRETVFRGDVVSLWDGIDLTVLGCEYGMLTPTSAVYRQSGSQAIYDGAIYNKDGDWMLPGFSMHGGGRVPFVDLPGSHHFLIIADPRALIVVNDIIAGRPISRFTAFESSYTQTSSIQPAVGMSDMIRVEIKSADPLAVTLRNTGIRIKIYDKNGRVIAQANGETHLGFSQNNFVYNAWSNIEYETNILCYIPLSGYSMEVFTGNINRIASNITVFTETLDPSGAILSRNEYKIKGANLLSGSIFSLEGSKSLKPATKIGATLTAVSAAQFRQNWRFVTDMLVLKPGAYVRPAISGPDASQMIMSAYDWSTSDPAVAVVSPEGLITAIAPGMAIITVTARDDSFKRESIEITVQTK